MNVTVLHTGPLSVNTLIVPLCGSKVLVVDPAACSYCGDEALITQYLAERALTPAAILLTHGHFDHVSGLPALCSAFPYIPVAIHQADEALIGNESAVAQGRDLREMGFSVFLPAVSALPAPTAFLEDNRTLADCLPSLASASGVGTDELSAALSCWQVLHTPGHTRGSCCFYNASEKVLLSGDTLFYRSWGRTDLYGGSETQIHKSLARIASTVSSDTAVYPGHDRYGFAAKTGL